MKTLLLLLSPLMSFGQVLHKEDTLYYNVLTVPGNKQYRAYVEINIHNDSNQFIFWVPDTPINDTEIFYGNVFIDTLATNALWNWNNTNETVTGNFVVFDIK